MPTTFFVYGTLKRGEIRESCWPYPAVSIRPASVQGRLYDLGPYPALVPGNERVVGELWSFAETHISETLMVIDQVEGYSSSENDLYRRLSIKATTMNDEEMDAFTYHYCQSAELVDDLLIPPDANGWCQWNG